MSKGGVINNVRACRLVLEFYSSHVLRFGEIHADLPSGALIDEIGEQQGRREGSVAVMLNAKFAKDFNDAYKRLEGNLRTIVDAGTSFEPILLKSYAVRIIWCVVAVLQVFSPWETLLVGLFQFLVAPLSFAVAVMRFGTNGSEVVFHCLTNFAVATFIHALFGAGGSGLYITIDSTFTIAFLLVDFALNLFVYLRSSEHFESLRLLKHACYGTMNTKTYFILAFGVLNGIQIDLLVAGLTGIASIFCIKFGVYTKVLKFLGMPCFAVLFYCEHRLGHCPAVYAHAHKMHHYLHDTTAFDAHVYGSGMNEEFFWVWAEIIPTLLAPATMFPYALNLGVLLTSWENKGAHTRTSKEGMGQFYDDDNWHADHHTLHRKNFGSAYMPLLDFYFGTQGSKVTGTLGNLYLFGKEGAVETGKIQVRFDKVAPVSQCDWPKTDVFDSALCRAKPVRSN